MKNSFRLEITQKNGSKIVFRKVEVALNINLENTWKNLENNSLVANSNYLLKITSLIDKRTFYLHLNNTNIFIEKDIIQINLFHNLKIYVQNKKRMARKRREFEINKIKEQIYSLRLRQEIGLTLEEMIQLNNLKNELYLNRIIGVFNLIALENFDEKTIS